MFGLGSRPKSHRSLLPFNNITTLVCLSVYPSVSMSRCDDCCPSDRTAVHLSHTLHRQHIQVQVGKNVDRLTTWICDQIQRSGVKHKILTMNDDVVVLMIVVKRHQTPPTTSCSHTYFKRKAKKAKLCKQKREKWFCPLFSSFVFFLLFVCHFCVTYPNTKQLVHLNLDLPLRLYLTRNKKTISLNSKER